MGHEITTTALQLARTCSTEADGGKLLWPHLTQRSQRPGEPPGGSAAQAAHRVLPEETAILIHRMMERVNLSGTAHRQEQVMGYTAGGKTDSAQIFDLHANGGNASFIGVAPSQSPKLAVMVTLNGVSKQDTGKGTPPGR